MNSDFSSDNNTVNAFDETMPTAAPGFIRFINYLLDCLFLAIVASVIINIFVPEMNPKSLDDVSQGKVISIL